MKAFAIIAVLLLFFGISLAEKVGSFEMGIRAKLSSARLPAAAIKAPVQTAKLAPIANSMIPDVPLKIDVEDFAGGMLDSIYSAGSDFCSLISGR